MLENLPLEWILRLVGETADDLGIRAFVVGGFVRDYFLKRPNKDLDFVTLGADSGITLANALAEKLNIKPAHLHKNFGTAGLNMRLPDHSFVSLEFVAARKESYQRNSRNPVVAAGTLEDDQNRRDFTINAMAVSVNRVDFGTLVDPFRGIEDLNQGILRTPLSPEQTFSDDPLRMMRAARFATQLDFEIEPNTFAAMKAMAERIEIISQERITEELQKIMVCPIPSIGFKILYQTNILHQIFWVLTDLAGVEAVDGVTHKDNFYHTLQVLDNVVRATPARSGSETLWLRWAAIFHDTGKTRTKKFTSKIGWSFHGHEEVSARIVQKEFARMRLPVDERMHYVRKLVRLHHRPTALVDQQVTDSAVRRLLFEAGETIDDLMILVRADITSKNPVRVARYLSHFDLVESKMIAVEEKDRLRNFQPPVDGNEIMKTLNLAPGPAVGKIKHAIEEAILEGIIPNEYDAAFAYMMAHKDQILA